RRPWRSFRSARCSRSRGSRGSGLVKRLGRAPDTRRMRGWGLVFGLLVGVALVAVVLQALPPFVVVALAILGAVLGLRRYRAGRRVEKERAEANALGLERSPDDRFGLGGLPFQLLARGGGEASVENGMWGTWGGVDGGLFALPCGAGG